MHFYCFKFTFVLHYRYSRFSKSLSVFTGVANMLVAILLAILLYIPTPIYGGNIYRVYK